jgi:AcrR family transcriptional regulator
VAKGRPRAFDVDVALDRALDLFWRKGYEGTSLQDLTDTIGVNRPSLYAAFGNKEALFRKAIDRYIEGPACHVRAALEEPTARGVVERLLRGTIQLITDPGKPHGCFMVQGALACGDTANAMRQEMAKRRAAWEAAVRERFERAVSDGDLPADADPANLAKYLAVISHGMAVQAVSGATHEELAGVVDMVLRAWPG